MTMRKQLWLCLAVSLAVHAAVLFGLGRSQWFAAPELLATLSVTLLAPPLNESLPPAAPIFNPQPHNQTVKQRTTQLTKPQKRLHTTPPEKHPPGVGAFTPTKVPAQVPVAQVQAAQTAPPAQRLVAHNTVLVPVDLGTTATALAPATTTGSPNTATRAPFQDVPAATAANASAHASAQAASRVPLTTELALVCPDKLPANYPLLSRRLNESGTVVLRVEIDERGTVASASVERSSGFTRLDASALAAVRQWRCRAPTRSGQPTRATALQPFHFKLQD